MGATDPAPPYSPGRGPTPSCSPEARLYDARVPASLRRAAVAAALALPATASAAAAQTAPLAFAPCAAPAGMRCATLTVPLDRNAPAGRTLALPVRMIPAQAPSQGTVVLLAGGPGEAALGPDGGYERAVARMAPRHDIVVFDQRGTGPTALRCASFSIESQASSLSDAAARCASELGPDRERYTTGDSVADIDDLRAALGSPTVTLLGVSYGTLVAQTYARLHPDRVSGLVLDSTLGPRGNQLLEPESYRGARRVLDELCSGNVCRDATSGLRRDVARLSARMALRGVPGMRVAADGTARPAVFGGPAAPGRLFDALGAGDVSPTARAAFPAAVRAALDGDSSMLWRIAGSDAGGRDVPARFSTALLSSTLCAESVLPWNATMTGPQRIAARDAAFAAAPGSMFAPFPRPGRGDTLSGLCLLWPNAAAAPLPAAPLPDVPTLIVEGSQDVRTPVEAAQSVKRQIPSARLVVLRGSGHSVISRGDPCVEAAITRFLSGAAVADATCRGAAPEPSRVTVPPRSLNSLAPARGMRGRAGRTVEAVRLTLRDITTAAAFGAPSGPRAVRFAGLRGGYGVFRVRGRVVTVELRGDEFVRGVRVTGTARLIAGTTRRHDVTVTGPAASRGTVHIRDRVATGVLDGRPFRAILPVPRG